MICPRPGLSVVFTAVGGVVRRRRKEDPLFAGLPEDAVRFVPARWPGGSEYQRWAAWSEARHSWAEANLPNGYEDMPVWNGVVPDMPWDEAEI